MKKLLIGILSLILLLPNISISAVKLATLINKNGTKIVVVAGSQAAQQYFGDGFVLYTGEPMLGFTVVSNYKTTLSRSITSTASTIYVSSLTTKDSHVLTMADLGSKVFLTLEPGSNKEEIIMCTGIGTLSWSSCTRGLAFYATSTSAVTANQKSHSAGSAIVMSNVHYVYDELVDKDTADTIDGVKTYVVYPRIQTYAAPTVDEQLAPKKYVDDTVSSGAPDATETVKGISELATGAEAATGTSSGSAARLVLPASLSNSNSSATNIIPVTGADGKLSANFIATSSNYTFTGNVNVGLVGEVKAYASSTVPTGWLACDGSTISSTTYATLFALVGYTYGGTAGGDFSLPNLKGRNIIGYGSATTTIDVMGETGGQDTHTMTEAELVAHTHSSVQTYANGQDGDGSAGVHAQGGGTTGSTGSSAPFNVLDPFVVMQYIIKY